MADRDDIYRWLSKASWRVIYQGEVALVDGLVSEGRAEWCGFQTVTMYGCRKVRLPKARALKGER